MTLGTKSLLWGVHQFLLHPIFVLIAWKKLYGRLPSDPRIWLAILIHDWGYWGCSHMDDEAGTQHPCWAARKMHEWFDRGDSKKWGSLVLFHSRHLAALHNQPPSELCYADKLASLLYPRWLYLLLGRLTGELWEYVELSQWKACQPNSSYTAYEAKLFLSGHPGAWFDAFSMYMTRWLEREFWSKRKAA